MSNDPTTDADPDGGPHERGDDRGAVQRAVDNARWDSEHKRDGDRDDTRLARDPFPPEASPPVGPDPRVPDPFPPGQPPPTGPDRRVPPPARPAGPGSAEA